LACYLSFQRENFISARKLQKIDIFRYSAFCFLISQAFSLYFGFLCSEEFFFLHKMTDFWVKKLVTPKKMMLKSFISKKNPAQFQLEN
jgi:hypothetical protein